MYSAPLAEWSISPICTVSATLNNVWRFSIGTSQEVLFDRLTPFACESWKSYITDAYKLLLLKQSVKSLFQHLLQYMYFPHRKILDGFQQFLYESLHPMGHPPHHSLFHQLHHCKYERKYNLNYANGMFIYSRLYNIRKEYSASTICWNFVQYI